MAPTGSLPARLRALTGQSAGTQLCAGWLSKSEPVCTHGLQTSLMLIQYLQKMLRMKLKAGMTHVHSSCLP
jgi:hypothetical protein